MGPVAAIVPRLGGSTATMAEAESRPNSLLMSFVSWVTTRRGVCTLVVAGRPMVQGVAGRRCIERQTPAEITSAAAKNRDRTFLADKLRYLLKSPKKAYRICKTERMTADGALETPRTKIP
jgi:hypothetical protein